MQDKLSHDNMKACYKTLTIENLLECDYVLLFVTYYLVLLIADTRVMNYK